MLLIQQNQICWKDKKSWTSHQAELIQGLKRGRNYLLGKNLKDFYLSVYDLEAPSASKSKLLLYKWYRRH